MPKYDARAQIEELALSVKGLITDVAEIKSNHLPHLQLRIDEVDHKIEKVGEKLYARPAWIVLIIISMLTGLVGFLAKLAFH